VKEFDDDKPVNREECIFAFVEAYRALEPVLVTDTSVEHHSRRCKRPLRSADHACGSIA
jgi:hypothetical protein